ncbi:MAG: restriction endonuclease subunit S [Paenibacillus macerans]|uniref:restriction endonuclease subunit S n=1 Tax=Paenibacillus macerans TaxID=44252 RepID=UPI00242F7E3C|nr:restriction endonuclease subunit S [Paenibacillus macerans]MBS5913798.1 restriction endonuclease subunit S [Paenibacillus macerans]
MNSIALKPYENYKEANLLWLQNVPEHWEIVGNKELWGERNIKNCVDEELLSVTIKSGVIRQKELLKNTSKRDLSNTDKSNYKLVEENDIVYNKMRMWQGAVGKSKFRGIVSPAYIVLKPKKDFNTAYFHYLLRTPDYIEESHRYSYGICDDQLNLRYEDFKRMKIILPPRSEQDQIVRFLDSKLAKINKYIRAKKKLIQALREQKQAIINETVTKGLDPHVNMKPTGIKWLEFIPEGWSCQKFSRVAKVKSNLVNPINYRSYYQVSPENIEKNSGKLLHYKTVRESGIISSNHLFLKGQILYSKVRPKLNKVTIAPFDGLCSADMYPIETHLNSKYLLHFMLSDIFIMQLSETDNRVKMPKINKEELGSIIIVVPPMDVQIDLVQYIEENWGVIDYAINKIENEISLVSEYRTRLISDVVTGKIDVRDIVVEDIKEENLLINEFDEEVDENEEVSDLEEVEI